MELTAPASRRGPAGPDRARAPASMVGGDRDLANQPDLQGFIPDPDPTLVDGEMADHAPTVPQQNGGRRDAVPRVVRIELVWGAVRIGIIEQSAS